MLANCLHQVLIAKPPQFTFYCHNFTAARKKKLCPVALSLFITLLVAPNPRYQQTPHAHSRDGPSA